jgi:ATP phosphoribosyltransferase
MDLLLRCGLKIKTSQNSLLCHVENLPIDILFVRDDDIPTLVIDEICELGIVGENVLLEQANNNKNYAIIKKLGFSRCRLSIAIPAEIPYVNSASLQGMRIATSYPNLLKEYLDQQNVQAEIMTISGSVEIAPRLDMADAICDLVSTGRTLEENNLKEMDQVIQSQAVLIKTQAIISNEKNDTIELLLRRIEGVLKAQESKYIMFHLPKEALESIKQLLQGCDTPTVIPLEGMADKVAVHAVSGEGVFWSTLEKLKMIGASSILVLPIEKMMN